MATAKKNLSAKATVTNCNQSHTNCDECALVDSEECATHTALCWSLKGFSRRNFCDDCYEEEINGYVGQISRETIQEPGVTECHLCSKPPCLESIKVLERLFESGPVDRASFECRDHWDFRLVGERKEAERKQKQEASASAPAVSASTAAVNAAQVPTAGLGKDDRFVIVGDIGQGKAKRKRTAERKDNETKDQQVEDLLGQFAARFQDISRVADTVTPECLIALKVVYFNLGSLISRLEAQSSLPMASHTTTNPAAAASATAATAKSTSGTASASATAAE